MGKKVKMIDIDFDKKHGIIFVKACYLEENKGYGGELDIILGEIKRRGDTLVNAEEALLEISRFFSSSPSIVITPQDKAKFAWVPPGKYDDQGGEGN